VKVNRLDIGLSSSSAVSTPATLACVLVVHGCDRHGTRLD
jgi:hypothetical protein